MNQVIITGAAEDDITGAAVWYHDQQTGLGEEFLGEIQSTLKHAAANPRHYPCLRRRPEVRRARTKRFPYRIFFILRPDVVVVFRVLHSARHDREWQIPARQFPDRED